MTKRFKQGKYLYIFLSIVLLISIIPLVYISFYSRPSADDYGYSISLYRYISSGNFNIFGLIKKAIEVDIHFYNNWQGLYTSAFLLAFQPSIFGEKYYCIGAILLLIISFLCVLYFIKTVFKILKIERYYAFLSILIFVFLYQQLPNLTEGLYWFNGAWNYMPFFFLSLVNMGLCLKYLFIKNRKKYIVLSCLLSFVISGGNHVTSFMNILILMVIVGYGIYKKKKAVILSLLFAIVGFILMYIAPGTAIRQAQFSNPSIIETLKQVIYRSYSFTSEYFTRSCVLYLLAIILFSIFVYKKDYFNHDCFKLSPIIYLFIVWIIFCGMLAVPYYAMGWWGEGRVWDVTWLFEAVSLTLIAIYSTWYILYKYFEVKEFKDDLFINLVFVGLVLLSSCWLDCNFIDALKELTSGEAIAFARAYDERIDKVKSGNKESVYVSTLPDSNLLKFSDISSDNGWISGSFSEYYNADEIYVIKTEWIKNNKIESYISDLIKDGLIVLSKDRIKMYQGDELNEYDLVFNKSLLTSLGNFSIITKDDKYQIMLEDISIKEGNIKELVMFDYLVLVPSDNDYSSRFIRVY